MARRVIWSKRAQNDRKEILKYWVNRNKSSIYSKKLNSLFKGAINLIAEYPKIGIPSNNNSAHVKVVRDYLIIYETDDTGQLIVLTIWDSRQDPEKLNDILAD